MGARASLCLKLRHHTVIEENFPFACGILTHFKGQKTNQTKASKQATNQKKTQKNPTKNTYKTKQNPKQIKGKGKKH